MASKLNPQIAQQIARLSQTDRSVPLSEVGSILRSIISQMPLSDTVNPPQKVQKDSRNDLARAIEGVDITEMREFILPNIERELAAIVEATGSATQNILSAVERIEQRILDLDSETGSFETNVREDAARIYEACSFQDITGQRMSKIITLLKRIEMRVEGLLGYAGDEAALERFHELKKIQDKEKVVREFLQGPQLADSSSSQEEIDKLFSD